MSRAGRASYRAVIGLGANLGDPLASLRLAARALAERTGAPVVGRSWVYRSPPAGGPPQPDYLNAAVLLQTTLAPRKLLAVSLGIERELGRARPDAVRWGPRPIDVDLLWLSCGSVDLPGLCVPHPRLRERVFALRPLLDVAPDAHDPADGVGYAALPAARAPIERLVQL